MNQIEAALHQAIPRPAAAPSSTSAGPSSSSSLLPTNSKPPFALIKSVDPAGPAGTAVRSLRLTRLVSSIVLGAKSAFAFPLLQGLLAQDSIVLFGDVDSENHQNLKAVAALVGRSEGVRPILSSLLTDSIKLTSVLT